MFKRMIQLGCEIKYGTVSWPWDYQWFIYLTVRPWEQAQNCVSHGQTVRVERSAYVSTFCSIDPYYIFKFKIFWYTSLSFFSSSAIATYMSYDISEMWKCINNMCFTLDQHRIFLSSSKRAENHFEAGVKMVHAVMKMVTWLWWRGLT